MLADTRRTVEQGRLATEEAPGGYRVRLDVFEGPFDLLLQLIARRKLEISEVDLAEITGDFLAHLRGGSDGELGGLDLETATHFLVVAATLVELKAARLLPSGHDDEYDDLLRDARDLLYARLLEYRAFRDVSRVLAEMLQESQRFVAREVPLEAPFRQLMPEARLTVDARGLAALAVAALAPKEIPRVSTGHIHSSRLTVREAAAAILTDLPVDGPRTTFRRLIAGLVRREGIVYFLALLELYKLGIVDLRQAEPFGPLHVERRPGEVDLAALEPEGEPPPEGPDAQDDRS